MLNQNSVMDCFDHNARSSSLTMKVSHILLLNSSVCCNFCQCTFWDVLQIKQRNKDTNQKSSEQQVFTPMCFDPEKLKKMEYEVNAKDIKFISCNALNGSTEEFSKKTLELINSLKFDKLTYPSSSVTKSQWIDTFSKSITRNRFIN